MKYRNISYPLYLNKKDIVKQIEVIGLLFNKYNFEFTSKYKSFRCFCIALNKNKIISIGINKSKTNPNYKIYADNTKMSIHAEIDMIMNIKKNEDFNKVSDIYIVRGYSKLLPSFPCEFCTKYIIEKFNNTNIHYFTDIWNTIYVKNLQN